MRPFVHYGGRKIEFETPRGWNVFCGEETPSIPAARNPSEKIIHALDKPIGSPRVEELAHPGMKAVILFDDLTRPTPVHMVLAEILNRLNKQGIEDGDISAVCALGTHPAPSSEELKTKIGKETFERLNNRIYNHDSLSKENMVVGRTSRGSCVEINPHVFGSDLIIGIGTCLPHVWAGFSGGSKIIMPGICSWRSVAEHHIKWVQNRNSRIGKLEGNFFYQEENEFARIVGLDFKVDFVLNRKNEVTDVFCGDVVREHERAAQEALHEYLVKIPHLVDLSVVSSYPMEQGLQSLKGLDAAALITKKGGKIIWVAPQKGWEDLAPLIEEVAKESSSNDYLNQLLAGIYPESCFAMGISALLCIWVLKRMRERFCEIVHVCEGLSRDQVEAMGMRYAHSIDEGIEMVREGLPRADVAVLASGGTALPVLSG